MTWAESSLRKITICETTTNSRVGPASYNTSSSLLQKPKTRRNQTFPSAPRETFGKKDIITPGPGAYIGQSKPVSTKKRPESSFFLSKSKRDILRTSEPDFPSAATYSKLEQWGKVRASLPPSNRPKPIFRPPHFSKKANFLDNNGRLVVLDEREMTEFDLGPGTYNPIVKECVKVHEINTTSRDPDLFSVKSYSVPPPTKYIIPKVETRIPTRIGTRHKEKAVEINPNLGNPIEYKPERGKTSVFKSRTQRKLFGGSETDVPGPGTYVTNLLPPKKKIGNIAGVAFGSRNYSKNKNKSDAPSPDTYYPTIANDNEYAGASLRNKAPVPELFPGNGVVGPDAYDINRDNMKKEASPAFAGEEKRFTDSKNELPGPADYDIYFEEERPASLFGTRYKNIGDWAYSPSVDNPSPQDFYVDKKDNERRGWTISRDRRFKPKKIEKTPGPCNYDVSQPFVKPSFNAGVPHFK